MVHLQGRLRKEILFSIQYLVDVNLQVLAKHGRELVYASNQRITVSLVDFSRVTIYSLARSGREVRPLDTVV